MQLQGHGLVMPLAWLYFSAMIPAVSAQGQCNILRREYTSCPVGKTWPQEWDCVRRQNTLKSLMDCVRIDRKGEDFQVCSDVDDGIPNGNEGYDEFLSGTTTGAQNCIAPRNVVLSGSLDPYCRQCSVGGALEACPMTDPSFHSCLCAHRVSYNHLFCLSKCFLGGQPADLSCRPQKREAAPGLDLEPPPERLAMRKRALQDAGGLNFVIDTYGRPVYENGVVGLPLPYWQKVIANGLGMKRCYLFPSSTDMWCIRWRLPQYVDPDYATGRVDKATYGTEHEEDGGDEDATPTQTAAPSSTAIPSVTLPPKVEVTSKPTPPGGAQTEGTQTQPTAGPTDDSSASLYTRGTSLMLGLQLFILYQYYA